MQKQREASVKQLLGHVVLFALLSSILCVVFPSISWGNAAEPPALVVLVKQPPNDLSIVLVSDKQVIQSSASKRLWEGYYSFRSRDINSQNDYVLQVSTKQKSFEITLNKPLKSYHHVLTLDLETETFTEGTDSWRSPVLVALRLSLTLLLEALVFLSFGFRKKRSWAVFLGINLLTQGALNIMLNTGTDLMPSYLIITLLVLELFVLIAEMIAFPLLLKEHSKKRILAYVLVANVISLVAGGYMITLLPV